MHTITYGLEGEFNETVDDEELEAAGEVLDKAVQEAVRKELEQNPKENKWDAKFDEQRRKHFNTKPDGSAR